MVKAKDLKVKDLVAKLKGLDPELEIVVDLDEDGYYTVEGVELVDVVDGGKVLNIKTSNES